MGAIRGAICADNTVEDISAKSTELFGEIIARNNLQIEDVDAVIFSTTSDLDACYPAKAVRQNFAARNTAFMCLAEAHVQGSLDHCIRVCVFAPKIRQEDCVHCYVGRASQLRSDL